MNSLMFGYKTAGRKGGLAITDWEVSVAKSEKVDVVMHSYLITSCSEVKDFLVEVKYLEDVTKRFSVLRSL